MKGAGPFHSHPILIVRRRMSVIFFKGLARSHKEIAELAGVSVANVTRVLRLYKENDLQTVATVTHREPVSALERYSVTRKGSVIFGDS